MSAAPSSPAKPRDRRTALVVVDVQRALNPPARLVARIERLTRRFGRVVFTRYVNPPGSLFRRRLGQDCCAPGSSDIELLIAPRPGDFVIDKSGYGLKQADIRLLQRAGIREVTVCGVDTDACVLGVLFSLFDAGILCRVREDLCWSSNGLHKQAMQIIKAQFAA